MAINIQFLRAAVQTMLVATSFLVVVADAANAGRASGPYVASHLGLERPVYTDALAPEFQDWSWATHSLVNSDPAIGAFSVSMEPDAFEGVYFRADQPISLSEWGAVRFQIHGGASGGQTLRVYLQIGAAFLIAAPIDPPTAGAWQQQTIDFSALGAFGSFDGLIFQDTSGGDQPTVYLDEIELLQGTPPPPGDSVTVSVDPAQNRRVIDPRIYGVNFGTDQQVADLAWPVRRWGGNSTTRYNWKVDVFNTAFDYFFQNIVNEVDDVGALPSDSAADRFVEATLAASSEPIITVPTIGWAPVDVREKKWAFSQAAYGEQTDDECRFQGDPPWCSGDSGNGLCDPLVNTGGFCSSGGVIVGNDPTDTSQPIGPQWVADWVTHLTTRFGTAAEGGPSLWALDNEPMLWNSTHRDVTPDGLDYDGLWQKTLATAQAIKAVDPGAQTLGPVVWGWCAYFTSAADTELPGADCLTGPDRDAHGGLPLLEWILQETCSEEDETGFRALDYLDIHFYPQGGVAGLSPSDSGEDPDTSARRLRSTRELWDTTYVSESWINQPVELIPRMRNWIDQRCPGTKLALTEYRWGTDDGLSSALAQVEALAIFGREGVDLATRWVAPEPGTLTEDAFRLFLDHDGSGTRVTGTSVRATSSNNDAVTAYGVDGATALYVVLINKDTAARPIEIDISGAGRGGDASAATSVLLTAAGLSDGPTLALGGAIEIEVPARAAALVVVPREGLFSDGFESGDLGAWSSQQP